MTLHVNVTHVIVTVIWSYITQKNKENSRIIMLYNIIIIY